ncbi:MAG: hypothetical protein JOZ62_19090 [Acidobacteriaceae bacterium]|nr:hypothetical protein [Acidobacteriaceae bacterium]
MMSPVAINLASEPFRRERAWNAVYAASCAVLLCTFCVLLTLILHERAQASSMRRAIESDRARLASLEREQMHFSSVLGRPENSDIFSRSVFLNELIARRSVSWTKIFEDLATVLPTNMRLEAIRMPQVAAEDAAGANHVQLDMVIGTDRAEAVVEFLKRLEASSLFGAASVVNQAPPTQNDPFYKYRVTVSYAQKL